MVRFGGFDRLPIMVRAGRYELHSIITGRIRLDGGAMFGVVPKVLWESVYDVDGLNRIDLVTRTLLAIDREADRVILLDTGCGSKWTSKMAERYGVQSDPNAIDRALGKSGLDRNKVTDVVVTHLHFDHNGGLIDRADGESVLRYPQARHWIHQNQWAHALSPNLKDRASYLAEDFATLADAGVLAFVEEGEEGPAPEFAWFLSHGHTPYQIHPVLGRGRERVLWAGDLVPTTAHLRLTWVMAYDIEPLRTIEEKKQIFDMCLREGVRLALPHDPRVGGVALDGTPERLIVAAALDF